MIEHTFELPFTEAKSALSSDQHICVVSIIGKSDVGNKFCKALPIDDLLLRNIFQGNLASATHLDTKLLSRISGFHDVENGVIYLHLVGVQDSSSLLHICTQFQDRLQSKGFLDVWSDVNVAYVQAMFFLFMVSHIVMIVNPKPVFDTSFLHIFKTLESLRQQFSEDISALLKNIDGIPNEWAMYGRSCSPRLLFVFLSNPLGIGDSCDTPEHSSLKSKKYSSIMKLEHALEDQIYKLFRKCRIITNISTNCLFAIPANQEFVHIYQSKETIVDPSLFFINQLKLYCQLSNESSKTNVTQREIGDQKLSSKSNHLSFKTFINQHTELALDKGFDDNVGRNCNPAYFHVPSVKLWFKIASKLFDFIYDDASDNDQKTIRTCLKATLNVDVKFSELRCKKVLPVASISYQENLPSLYTLEYHQRKIAHTLKSFSKHARGPAYNQYAERLINDCDKFWHNGHQLCEVVSLTGNNCSNPVHSAEKYESSDSTLPLMKHVSLAKMVGTCNCGKMQASREDPFDIKTANYDFYQKLSQECCYKLMEKCSFPVFQPSSPDSKEASVSRLKQVNDINELEEEMDRLSYAQMTDNAQDNSASHADTDGITVKLLSLGEVDSEGVLLSTGQHIKSLENNFSMPTSAITNNSNDEEVKSLERQVSTTEYLPGMLHSESPPGLLPLYSYWSLVCLGPSSLYSHNIGINDQPGFILGTNFLLPWDVSVKLTNKNIEPRKDQRRNIIRGKGKHVKDSLEIAVKVFVGMEYECPLGHRFMCSAPEKILKVSGNGLVKDNANKVISNDMPLYCNCPCRTNMPIVAQLMRIHIVTPKTAVNILLDPRVQPEDALCPIFYPGNAAPIPLSPSAYWVLRLPFVYQGDNCSYFPPKELQPGINCGRLLKSVCWIVESGDVK